MTNRMGELAHNTLLLALEQVYDYSEARETEIVENEGKLDIYEDRLGSYLVQISQHGVSMDDIRTVSRLLHAIGDFERIGDHALNLQETAQEIHDKGIHFSESGDIEINILVDALKDIMDKTFRCFTKDDVQLAFKVEPLEETMDRLIEEVRSRHIQRLQAGQCTIQLGFVLSDLLTNFERVSDHCSNIAVSVLEEHDATLDRHAYMEDLKTDDEFNSRLSKALTKYQLPNN